MEATGPDADLNCPGNANHSSGIGWGLVVVNTQHSAGLLTNQVLSLGCFHQLKCLQNAPVPVCVNVELRGDNDLDNWVPWGITHYTQTVLIFMTAAIQRKQLEQTMTHSELQLSV